jgi:hypothetical protein
MHETIEGEVILINLDTGTYYSLRDTGAAIWQGVEHGADEAEIAAEIGNAYEGEADEIRAATRGLLEVLESEQLISPSEGEPPAEEFRAVLLPGEERATFRAPVLEKHTDMQDLILIDPVHQVDARGWPHRAEHASQ